MFSKSLSNDPWAPDALPQLQLMEGMQLSSALAPERLERARARLFLCVSLYVRACVSVSVRAFGSNRLHIMGLQ